MRLILSRYGDDLANLGNLRNTTPGKYLITYDSSADCPENISTNNLPHGFAGIIKFPVAYGLTILRLETNRSEADVEEVNAIQKSFAVRSVKRGGEPAAPRLNLSMVHDPKYNVVDGQTFYEAVMQTTAALAHLLPSYVVGDRAWVDEWLNKAGVHDDEFIQPEGTNLTEAVKLANMTLQATIKRPDVTVDVGNGWTVGSDDLMGVYNSEYVFRYGIAATGYLALTPDQAVYPSQQGELHVANGEALLYTFTEPPFIKEGGFWSLTAYGPDQDLIPNDLDKYMVGDRSNLTFPDGTPISSGEKKPFQVLLQSSEVQPPANWTNK